MSSTIRALFYMYVQHDMPCMCTLVHYTTSITIHAPDDGKKNKKKNSLLDACQIQVKKSKRRNSLFTDLPASTHFAAGCFDLKLAVNTNVGPRCCVL